MSDDNKDVYKEKDIDDNSGDEIIHGLLSEFKDQRLALHKMIEELETIRKNVDKLFPETLDKRFLMYFQEKVKAVTGLYSSLLDMRKEINKSLKDEIELRRKVKSKEDDEDIDDLMDIRSIADKVNKLQKEKEKKQAKVEILMEENLKESSKILAN